MASVPFCRKPATAPPSGSSSPSSLRWLIVALLCGAAILNYVDRLLLSMLAPTIQADLQFDDRGYATIVNVFLVAYTVSYLGAGALIDRIGTRVSIAICVTTWSVANALTSLARTVASLSGCQFFLGLGEAGFWTACPKIVAQWFPASERAVATGLYILGSTLGAMIVPLVAVPLARHYPWQLVFVVTGVAGFLWLFPWLKLGREPGGGAATDAAAAGWSWWEVWRHKLVWRLVIARMLTDPVWYFLQFWFAKYLFSDRHLAQADLTITWWIFAAASVAMVLGGLFSWKLVRLSFRPANARLAVMRFCALLMPAFALIPWVSSVQAAVALGAGITFSSMCWLINLSTLIIDCIPARSLATVYGIAMAGSAVGGMVMNSAVAGLIQTHTYASCFVVLGVVHPLAWLIVRPIAKERGEAAPFKSRPASTALN